MSEIKAKQKSNEYYLEAIEESVTKIKERHKKSPIFLADAMRPMDAY